MDFAVLEAVFDATARRNACLVIDQRRGEIFSYRTDEIIPPFALGKRIEELAERWEVAQYAPPEIALRRRGPISHVELVDEA